MSLEEGCSHCEEMHSLHMEYWNLSYRWPFSGIDVTKVDFSLGRLHTSEDHLLQELQHMVDTRG